MNRIKIPITKCPQCTDYVFDVGRFKYHCKHLEAPYNGECTSTIGIPRECPRLIIERKEKPIIIIINGYPESGKDTFCGFANNIYNTTEYSTVDTVKDIATEMGWNGIKTPYSRNMLSALKDFYVEWFDGTFVEMTNLIDDIYRHGNDKFIFLHTREPEEIGRVVQWCEETCKVCYTVFINRDVSTKHDNHADADVYNYKYDIYIDNYGTLEGFKKKSLDIFSKMVDNTI